MIKAVLSLIAACLVMFMLVINIQNGPAWWMAAQWIASWFVSIAACAGPYMLLGEMAVAEGVEAFVALGHAFDLRA